MSEKIKINDVEFEPKRTTLRGWAKLDEIRLAMDEAISTGDFENYFLSASKFVEIASVPNNIKWEEVSWFDFLTAFFACVEINKPTIPFPILNDIKVKDEKPPWEYSGRSWYFWLNLFASAYGWTQGYVGDLDIDTAIGLYQELEIDDQLQREFTYSLSELAYPYNEKTKKSRYVPLERPNWMRPIVQKPKKIQISRDLLPLGIVVNLADREKKRGS